MDKNILFADLPRGSISTIIKDRIINAIVCGDLKPGDKIPTETEFSENLGIGRGPVREAVKILVEFGVLEIRHAEGTFVVKEYSSKLMNPLFYDIILSQSCMDELLEFKIVLYQSLLYLAMRNASDEEIYQLQNLCQKYREQMTAKKPDITKIFKANESMRRYLATIAHNESVSKINEIALQIAKVSCIKAIEESILKERTNDLPDSYEKDFEMLAKRDKSILVERMDEKLALWEALLQE